MSTENTETVTFYSYKGGLGRSLLLANMAHALCAAGRKVFAIDLDFEAPGLHYKLSPQSRQQRRQGALDYLVKVQRGEHPGDLSDYVETFERHENLLLLPAGDALDSRYLDRLGELDTLRLFAKTDSPGFDAFALLRQSILERYEPDYLLIDARTGITQIGTFALKFLADSVVCLFSCSAESYEGARLAMRAVESANAERAQEHRTKIFPVISRVPSSAEGPRMVKEYCAKLANDLPSVRPGDVSYLHSDASFEVDDRAWADARRSLAASALLGDTVEMARKLFHDDRALRAMLAPISMPRMLRPAKEQHSPVPISERFRRRQLQSSTAGGESLRPLLMKIDKGYVKGSAYRDWIADIIDGLLASATKATGNADELVRVFGGTGTVDIVWEEIPELMRVGALDFCADPFYMNKSRQLVLGHFPFAAARNFTLVALKDGAADRLLRQGLQSTRADSTARCLAEVLQPLLDRQERGLVPSDIVAMQDTTAASECQTTLASLGYFAAEMTLVDRSTDLLRDLPDHGLAVADFGLLEEAMTSMSTHEPDCRTRYSYGGALTVKYRLGPIPVGLVYPREDSEWGCDMARVVGEMIRSGRLSRGSWDAIAKDLQRVDLDACSFDELCFVVARGMPMGEGLQWLRKIGDLSEA